MGAAAGLAGAAGGIGSGAGILDFNAAKKAQKAQKKGTKQTIGTYNTALDNTANRYNQQRFDLSAILPMLEQANTKALQLSARMGSGRTADVLNRENFQRGALEQNLVARGLGNSTAGLSQSRGITDSTNRALLDINDAVTGYQGGLIQSGAAQKANILSQRAGTYGSQSAQEAALYEALANFLGGIQHTAGPSALGGIAGIAKLFASFGGGGAGAGGAAQGTTSNPFFGAS